MSFVRSGSWQCCNLFEITWIKRKQTTTDSPNTGARLVRHKSWNREGIKQANINSIDWSSNMLRLGAYHAWDRTVEVWILLSMGFWWIRRSVRDSGCWKVIGRTVRGIDNSCSVGPWRFTHDSELGSLIDSILLSRASSLLSCVNAGRLLDLTWVWCYWQSLWKFPCCFFAKSRFNKLMDNKMVFGSSELLFESARIFLDPSPFAWSLQSLHLKLKQFSSPSQRSLLSGSL